MNFKPTEFFIGLVEFITILLPGAVLTVIFLVMEKEHPVNLENPIYTFALDENLKVMFWVAFAFSSFGLGYFLSSIASGLDPFYDYIRRHTYPYQEDIKEAFQSLSPEKQTQYLKVYEDKLGDHVSEKLTHTEKCFEGFKLSFTQNYFRRFLGLIFNMEFRVRIDKSYEETRKILNAQPEAVRNANNAFKWAITVLEAHYPAINEQATRIMAASKFFRSMVIVTSIFFLLQLTKQVPSAYWSVNIVVLILSFREYIVQRRKSVLKTYQSIVTLTYFNLQHLVLPKESQN